MSDLLTAFALLTIVPVRGSDSKRELGKSLAWFPVVGMALGLVLALAFSILRVVFANLVAASIVVALWAILTGALHLDGFSDACDGLFAATTRERRLEILHDVHLGAFGAVGLILLLILQVVAVANTLSVASIFLAPVLGRWAMVSAAAYPLARTEGMAALCRTGFSRREIFIATLMTGVIVAFFGNLGLIAFIAAFIVATLIARFATSRVGGLTGDIYGMICESVQVTVLLIGNVVL